MQEAFVLPSWWIWTLWCGWIALTSSVKSCRSVLKNLPSQPFTKRHPLRRKSQEAAARVKLSQRQGCSCMLVNTGCERRCCSVGGFYPNCTTFPHLKKSKHITKCLVKSSSTWQLAMHSDACQMLACEQHGLFAVIWLWWCAKNVDGGQEVKSSCGRDRREESLVRLDAVTRGRYEVKITTYAMH